MNSGYPGFGCPVVIFLISSFHFVNKNSCVIYFPHYFVNTLRTHTLAFILEVNFYFSIYISGLGASQEALYVEGLKVNLLSIRQLCDNELVVQFSKKECNIFDSDVQILILASVRIICSKVYTSARSYPQGSVCKQKSITI
jgi:hypothetical protein